MPERWDTNEWVWMFQRQLRALAKDRTITFQVVRVYLLLCSHLTFAAVIPLKQKDIMAELGIDQGDTSRALKALVERGMVLRQKHGRQTGYQLNSHFVYKGPGRWRPSRHMQQSKLRTANNSKTRAGAKNASKSSSETPIPVSNAAL